MLGLAALCLLAAVLELDATSAGQWMVSRPLALGGLLGWLGGDAPTGFMLGGLIELLLLAELPVGGAVPLNGTIACAVAVAAALPPRPQEAAWSLALGLAAGWAFRPFEIRLRAVRSRFVDQEEKRVREGEAPRFPRTIAASLTMEVAVVFVFLAVAVPAAKLLGGWWWQWEPLRQGARFAWKGAPALALIGAVHVLNPRSRAFRRVEPKK